MYKHLSQNIIGWDRYIQRVSDGAVIPFDPGNTDYANFKEQINAGETQLEDADGNLMSADTAKTYVAGLP